MSQEQAKQKIGELIKKYEEVLKSGEVKKYTEEETKKDFILPLFGALGWDVFNKKEVSAEEHIKSSGRVDYGFYINGRTKFYLEAKPLKADLNDEDFAKQAIRYSWNRGVSYAVLTNFETIKLFNAQAESKQLIDKLIFEISHPEFIERFDELFLLSQEALTDNLLDNYAEKHAKKFSKVTVNEKLFKDLKEIRESLTRSFRVHNDELTKPKNAILLDEGVQKVIDRLVFIRVIEDRELEPPILIPLLRDWEKDRKKSLYQLLISTFHRLNDTYNSNIFLEGHPSDKWEEYDGAVADAINALRKSDSIHEYDFKFIPADILGGVYESYLGYIAKKGSSKKGGEQSRAKRKEQGIYYTPSFIVDYIVKNALGPVLDRCRSIEDLKKIKVLDPACGSGSFLIKAQDMIYDKYKEFNRNDPYVKIQILTENIYGVDLDPQAIELARLNLLINTISDKIKLPNLAKNVKVGNSLISGTDEELKKHFGKNFRDKKPFSWQEEFPEVFKQGGFDVIIGNPPYIKEFVNKNAFDGLHNSPYYQGKMDIWTMFGCIAIDLLKDGGKLGFIAPNNWITNTGASIFRDKILKDGELKTFIDFGDYKVFEQAGIQTMIFVFEKKKPSEKYEIDYLRVDDKNIAEDKLIIDLFGEKTKIDIEPEKLIGKNIVFSTSESDLILNKLIQKGNYHLLDDDLTQGIVPNPDVINSRNINKIPDSDIKKFDIKINDGVFVVPKKYFGVSDSEKKYFKPLFDTEQIGRYKFDQDNKKELIYIPKNEGISENSAIIKHLSKYRPIMEERRENLNGSIKYYNLHWPRNSRYFEKGPKIISVRKCKIPTFSYTEDECYVMLTFNVIKTDKINLKYLMALLNSKLIYFWLKQKGKLQGDMFQIDTEPLQQIPIYVGAEKMQKQIITLVDKMLSINKELCELPENSEKWLVVKSEIARTDRKIDEEVYKFYGLTPEEIKIVEGNNK